MARNKRSRKAISSTLDHSNSPRNRRIQSHIIQQDPVLSEQVRRKKSWSIHDLKRIQPLTESQRQMIAAFDHGDHVLASGSAGTGKTYLACHLALKELLSDLDCKYDKIVLLRSAVPSRDIGFLPGTIEEKQEVYERPYVDIMADLLGREASYYDLKDANKLEFMLTSYVRGITIDNAIIVVDECQSATFHELYSVITRVGENSRLILCGDLKQDDLHSKRNSERSGLESLINVCKEMSSVDIVNFTENDIVRSGFVKDFIIACQRSGL